MVVGEDVLFILECLNKGTFSYIKEYLYNYIYHSESLMNKKWKKADYISDLDAWKKFFLTSLRRIINLINHPFSVKSALKY